MVVVASLLVLCFNPVCSLDRNPYLLDTFAEAARLPGLAGLFDPAHNPLFRLPLSGDASSPLDFNPQWMVLDLSH